jgi:hypothetical protein
MASAHPQAQIEGRILPEAQIEGEEEVVEHLLVETGGLEVDAPIPSEV